MQCFVFFVTGHDKRSSLQLYTMSGINFHFKILTLATFCPSSLVMTLSQIAFLTSKLEAAWRDWLQAKTSFQRPLEAIHRLDLEHLGQIIATLLSTCITLLRNITELYRRVFPFKYHKPRGSWSFLTIRLSLRSGIAVAT